MENNKQKRETKITGKFGIYLSSHLRAGFASLGKVMRTPFASFMTVAVIGIALALPTIFFLLLQNSQRFVSDWSAGSTLISVYLKPSLAQIRVEDVIHQLKMDPRIADVEYVSPQQGLQELTDSIGAQKIIQTFNKNPLPGLIVMQPVLSMRSSLELNKLMEEFKRMPEVDSVQLDQQWLQRMHAIINFIHQLVFAIGMLLALGVLLIVGNTIRLIMQSEHQEITVLKLVGATNAFIRRPFLYAGIWYGFFGAIIAWIITAIVLNWLQNPVTEVASLYNSSFYLHSINVCDAFNLLFTSCFLCLLGSWFAVSRKLRIIS